MTAERLRDRGNDPKLRPDNGMHTGRCHVDEDKYALPTTRRWYHHTEEALPIGKDAIIYTHIRAGM